MSEVADNRRNWLEVIKADAIKNTKANLTKDGFEPKATTVPDPAPGTGVTYEPEADDKKKK